MKYRITDNGTTLPDIHDPFTNAKRAQPPNMPAVPNQVVIGIILGVIALIACAGISLLLWRLSRQTRRERSKAKRVDLLDPGLSLVPGPGDPEQGQVNVKLAEKPLPRSPRMSTESCANSSRDQPNERPVSTSHYAAQSTPPIRRPSQAMARQSSGQTYTTTTSTDNNTSTILSSMTPSYARTQSVSSVGGVISHSRTTSGSGTALEQFTIVNVTESDAPRFQQPQLLYGRELPPDYKVGLTRGRDPPFPLQIASRQQLAPITTSTNRTSDGNSSTVAPYPSDKGGLMSVPPTPGTSYAIQVPISQSSIPNSPFISRRTSRRSRNPLTITASQPVSNVVIGDVGPIRRLDGTLTNGRMVTMSVLVEDEDSSSSDEELDQRDPGQRENRASRDGNDALEQVIESYSMDLPPYTPRREHFSVSAYGNSWK